MENAVRYSPNGGDIEVEIVSAMADVVLSVHDHGIGIPRAEQQRIFEMFFKATTGVPYDEGGLGIGLFLAREITRRHGGDIWFESEEGEGTTFRLRLPPADGLAGTTSDPGRQAADSSQPSALPSLDGTRVLVVDDQEDACTLFGHLLEERGAQVTTARSVDEAVGRLDADEFDVLVSDIAMPVRDGFDLIRHVRQHMNGLPAIALTAFAGAEDRERTLAAGFQAHLTKPVAPEQLIRAVAGLRGR